MGGLSAGGEGSVAGTSGSDSHVAALILGGVFQCCHLISKRDLQCE